MGGRSPPKSASGIFLFYCLKVAKKPYTPEHLISSELVQGFVK